MQLKLSHVRAGCNTSVGVLSWGPGSIVACGSHSAVLLYDVEVCRHKITTACMCLFMRVQQLGYANEPKPISDATG